MKTNKGFKVTNKNMQCLGFQYELGKEFRHEGRIELCEKGFHFCKRLAKCFSYYLFNPTNRVFEIEHGDVIGTIDDKMVTDRIIFLRELTWAEVLDMVNTGFGNPGQSNTGDYNSGSWNTGNYNSGNYNSGGSNSGYSNSGKGNTGNYNSGNYNSGSSNSGYSNSGINNSGCDNSGNWNSGNWNSGFLNSEDSKLRIFNKKTNIPRAYIKFPNWLSFELVEWCDSIYMTDEEKEENPNFEITGGYLKVLDYKEAAQASYNRASKEDQDLIEKVPNYDADVLFEIFGIDRRNK